MVGALKQRIADEMKAALLGGDRFVGETLRNLKAAILNEEVATGKRDEGLSDEAVEKVIAREVKKRGESAKLYRENNRPELAEPEEAEAEVDIQQLYCMYNIPRIGQIYALFKSDLVNGEFGAGDDTGVYWNDKKELSKEMMLFFTKSA